MEFGGLMTVKRLRARFAGAVLLAFSIFLPSYNVIGTEALASPVTRAGGAMKAPAKPPSRRAGTVRRSTRPGKSSASSRAHHRGKGRSKSRHKPEAKPKYAYPLEFFMMKAPDFDRTPFDEERASKIRNQFQCGIADHCSPAQLVKAGVFLHYPLSGGIFKRREPIKWIILHSTETGRPVPAKNVINGWNGLGRRHPGTQYVVERDGTIYQALDPEFGAVHVNIFKTLPGINNDNSIGIEMNHTGKQDYPEAQRAAVVRLVTYLQHRFNIPSDSVITHKYAQQGDHTDPVNMDVEAFLAVKESFRTKALAMRKVTTPFYPEEQTEDEVPVASVYVQIHGMAKIEDPPAALSGTPGDVAPGVTTETVPASSQPGLSPQDQADSASPNATGPDAYRKGSTVGPVTQNSQVQATGNSPSLPDLSPTGAGTVLETLPAETTGHETRVYAPAERKLERIQPAQRSPAPSASQEARHSSGVLPESVQTPALQPSPEELAGGGQKPGSGLAPGPQAGLAPLPGAGLPVEIDTALEPDEVRP